MSERDLKMRVIHRCETTWRRGSGCEHACTNRDGLHGGAHRCKCGDEMPDPGVTMSTSETNAQPATRQIKICPDPDDPSIGTIHVDDFDMSEVTQGVDLHWDGGFMPVLTVRLGIFGRAMTFDGPAKVEMAPNDHAALVALGWTPPEGS